MNSRALEAGIDLLFGAIALFVAVQLFRVSARWPYLTTKSDRRLAIAAAVIFLAIAAASLYAGLNVR